MKRILLFILMVGATACEHPYTIDEQQVPPKLVVDALLTNQQKVHEVKLTQSSGFYTTGSTPRVSGATVTVADDVGNSFVYVEDPQRPGVYESPEFSGVVGRTYSLTIAAAGITYNAEDTMMPVTEIDSLTYFLDEEEREYLKSHDDVDDPERYYQVQLYTTEPAQTVDYYLFKFYRDGDLINGNGEDVYYSDDEFLQENIEGVAFNDWYELGELAKIEMYSITRDAFLYYKDVDLALNNDGGLFSPLPANPRTNLDQEALGFFQVSAVASDSIRIE